jgi:signal transduction histidine kinase
VKEENSRLIIRVQDNGKGAEHLGQGTQPLAANKRREGLGLRSMQYRAHQLGADYRLVSSKDAGMLVEVSMPLDEKS